MARRPNLSSDQLAELEEQFYLCRGPIKHQWEHIIASKDQRPSFGTKALFRCSTCTTERHDVFSRITGDLLARWYIYPDHYADTPRHGSAYWRAFWAQRVYEEGKLVDSETPSARPTSKQRGKRAALGQAKPSPVKRAQAS